MLWHPSGLSTSTDPQATQINSLLQAANLSAVWFQLFEAPAGAAKSNTPIGGKSGKNGRTAESVVVYTWTADDGAGNTWTVAYQIGESGSNYTFEIFFQFNESDFERIIYAEESKDDLANGFMEIYSLSLFGDEISDDDYFFRFEWTENAIGLKTFTYEDSEQSFQVFITVNPDGSGSVSAREATQVYYEATWNATGTAGTYTFYDSSGEIIDSGVWPE
ncbi:MAG: hypothetical protein AAGF85_08010 [Bacteroidota bacterium]